MIIYSKDDKKQKWPKTDKHDPNSKKYYAITYAPPVRQDSTVYVSDVDVVAPATFNGLMFECVSGGLTAETAPDFCVREGDFVDDGCVRWKALAYRAKLRPGAFITASEWFAEDGIVLDNSSIISARRTVVRVTSLPASIIELGEFELTNRYTVTHPDTSTEEFDKTLVIQIAEL